MKREFDKKTMEIHENYKIELEKQRRDLKEMYKLKLKEYELNMAQFTDVSTKVRRIFGEYPRVSVCLLHLSTLRTG